MRRGWEVFLWPRVCLFQLGLIAGTLILGSHSAEPNKPAPPEPGPEPRTLTVEWKRQCPEFAGGKPRSD